jgi:hypothetical protein
MTSKRWASRSDAEAFFVDDPLGLAVFERLQMAVDRCGGAELRVAATQVGWARRRGFAFLWSASQWLGPRAAPLVLSLYFPTRVDSPRWKQLVQVRPGLWVHHLEVREVTEIDDEVLQWLADAFAVAG